MHKITKIVTVINDMDMLDTLLSRALKLAKEQVAGLEIIFVHEEEFFSLPEYFRFKESEPERPFDIAKIKKEIIMRLTALGGEKETPVLVYIDDTIDHVLLETEDVTEAMIVMTYHEKIAKGLISKSHLPVLIIKNDITEEYTNIVIPVDLSPISKESIQLAKRLFPTKEITLVHDFRALYMEGFISSEGLPVLEMPLELGEVEKEAAHKEFEALRLEMGCHGRFITEKASFQEDFFDYVQEDGNDLAVLGSNNADSLFFDSVSFDLMEELPIDILVYAPRSES